MGRVINYRTILARTEQEITEWDETLMDDDLELENGDDLELGDVLDMLNQVEAHYYLGLFARAEQLHRWVEQDKKYGTYRRGEVFNVGH
jgi:hypothetical protein